MCGIAGWFNFVGSAPVELHSLRRMANAVKHRGPDDEGFYVDESAHIGLAHRRLSIIDLSGGKQPMSNARETIWISFNGEIYNYLELRRELESRGCVFRTNSDTEVIIYLYQEYGAESFCRLNGIFAFAIYDKSNRCLVLARDHFGVKPLYYYLSNGTIVFGSEIKAILQSGIVDREFDLQSFNSFLTFRYNPSPQTLLKGIKKLYPGHFLKIEAGREPKIISYWKSAPVQKSNVDEKEAVEEYRRLIEQAVRRQLVSDVPVGLLLSGGVDSAVLGHLMQKNYGKPIKTFTIGFAGKGDYNEMKDASETAKWLGTEHHEITLTQKEYFDFFFRSFEFCEEPIAETTISALYYVSRLASEHLKVVLAGQGADEPMAGYKRYLGLNLIDKYAPLMNAMPLKSVARWLPRNERFKRAVFASQFTEQLDRILAVYTIFTPEQKNFLLNSETRVAMSDIDKSLVERLYDECAQLPDALSKILYIDCRMSLSDNLLLFNDKITMANSLEMRVPFLDLDLMAFVESLPSRLKLKGYEGKYIHKKAVEGWLPKDIVYRKKRGFQTPMDLWLQTDLSAVARDLFRAPDSACRQFFELSKIDELISAHTQKRENFQRHIFALLSFEVWYRSFFKNENITADSIMRSGREK